MDIPALLAEARIGEDLAEQIKQRFQSHSVDQMKMTPEEFSGAMSELGAKREYCTQYFKAFDEDGDGRVDFHEFLLGSVAMEDGTYHGGIWGEKRSRYIFRTYDLNSDGYLDYGELLHVVRHIRRARGESEAVADIESHAKQIVDQHSDDGRVPMAEWLAAVGSKKIRGTSKLFRLGTGYRLTDADKPRLADNPWTNTPSEAPSTPEYETAAEPAGGGTGASVDRTQAAAMDGMGEIQRALPAGGDSMMQVHLAHTAIKADQEEGHLVRAVSEIHGKMAVERVRHISPCLVGSQGSTEQATRVAMHVIETLVLDEQWLRTETFCPQVMSADNVLQLTDQVSRLLQTEETVVDLPAPCKVFGDIHGQFTDLKKFFATYGSPNHRTGDVNLCRYVFIGDFVDRGACSLETVCSLFSLKVRYPSRITLVRGNHEDRNINMQYGFREECIERCGDDGIEIWERVNSVFDWLPLAACIEGKILCLHGGPGATLTSVDEIRKIQRPVALGVGRTEMTAVLWDILWSDPTEDDTVIGCHPNAQRGAGGNIVKYGPDRVKEFCASANLKLIIRAHECVQDGYQYFASCHLITVFSATNYCARYDNDGAFLEISIDGSQLSVVPKVIKAKTRPASAQGHWRQRQFRPPSPVRGGHAGTVGN
jgi:diadenosine tetraphosphatase ApaH/serine/threonine PP2A family protein phosphatase/Ca2+-binding EF-hand superfamily protein